MKVEEEISLHKKLFSVQDKEVPTPALEMLDSSTPDFYAHLDSLDSLPTRHLDTAFVFYVKAGQHSAADILSNLVLF